LYRSDIRDFSGELFADDCYDVRVLTSAFDFELPAELIAQVPSIQRDESRLLTLDRASGRRAHHRFRELPDLLTPGDLLVINNSRVMNARLRGRNCKTGGRFELLLTEENTRNDWWAMMKPGRRATPNTRIELLDPSDNVTGIFAEIIEANAEGHRRMLFRETPNILDELDHLGELPLPPYIKRSHPERVDRERYQTIYANDKGSLAAPTAGLHFTPQLLTELQARGIRVVEVTLHVGLGTFAPVKAAKVAEHVMHSEHYVVTPSAAAAINLALEERRRVVAVGTTSLRVLESIGRGAGGRVVGGRGRTQIFIYPPAEFTMVRALITNFHLPRSTLLMLVSAFAAPGHASAGRDLVLETYAEAVRERYRFFSYGDAMFIF
jgi:S-adenosylmethionine:tRNA ribosyltransferase-isomerase